MKKEKELKELGLQLVESNESDSVWTAHGPHKNESLFVKVGEGNDESVCLVIMPDDQDLQPLIVNFSRWVNETTTMIEGWVMA